MENQKRILIADDEKNIRLTVSRSLESLNYFIDTALNGEEALQKIKENPYDLLLLDLRMPGMSGMEVIEKLNEMNIKIKIVVISAHGTIETAVQAMKSGAADYIEKPFAPNDIRTVIQKVLGV